MQTVPSVHGEETQDLRTCNQTPRGASEGRSAGGTGETSSRSDGDESTERDVPALQAER